MHRFGSIVSAAIFVALLISASIYFSDPAVAQVPSGKALVREGRTHLGTPYRLSPPAPCKAYRVEDCSCFTSLVFRHFGKRLPDDPTRQYHRGRKVSKSNLRRGDLVFFKEHGRSNPITHVAMVSGRGTVLHASSYFGKVVNSEMRYIDGFYGARRIR